MKTISNIFYLNEKRIRKIANVMEKDYDKGFEMAVGAFYNAGLIDGAVCVILGIALGNLLDAGFHYYYDRKKNREIEKINTKENK